MIVWLFYEPSKNDTISICDELRIYPYTVETDEEYSMDIRVQGEQKLNGRGI